MLVFTINRCIFFISAWNFVKVSNFSDVLYAFVAALRLDLSTASYFLILPFLLVIFSNVSGNGIFIRIAHVFNFVFILIYNLISFGEMSLYQEWRTKLNIQALLHFQNPSEVFRSASWFLILLFAIPLLLFTWLYFKAYWRWVAKRDRFDLGKKISFKSFFSHAGISAVLALLLIFALRGGLQAIPISESDSYYSQNQTLNDGALNPARNLVKDAIEYSHNEKENPLKVMDADKAKAIVDKLYQIPKDTTEIFLDTNHPNIIFLILESWSANVIKSYGGLDFTPFFDSIAAQGIKFTNFYPAAYVSDQGVPAVLSAYPSTSKISVINDLHKTKSLPCINKDLEKLGYHSGFVFGGQLNYGNIKGYLYNEGFDLVKEGSDFDKNLPRGSLGIPDQDMAKEFINTLKEAKEPFFYTWYTLSTHSPYDFPRNGIHSDVGNYEESMIYADEALRKFFNAASKQPWYGNTLFVLVSDHGGHNRHNLYVVDQKETHHIPLLFYGNAIKQAYRGREIYGVFSQLDIVPTVLHQLGLEASDYSWGKNMLNPYSPHFAYYCYHYGAGWINDEGYVAFHHDLEKPVRWEAPDSVKLEEMLQTGRAFQQLFYDDFLSR